MTWCNIVCSQLAARRVEQPITNKHSTSSFCHHCHFSLLPTMTDLHQIISQIEAASRDPLPYRHNSPFLRKYPWHNGVICEAGLLADWITNHDPDTVDLSMLQVLKVSNTNLSLSGHLFIYCSYYHRSLLLQLMSLIGTSFSHIQ